MSEPRRVHHVQRTLAEELDVLEDEDTTFTQISHALGDNVKFVHYQKLSKYSKLEDMFSSEKNVILFFPVESEASGHFVCLMQYPDGTVSYFCPYGMTPAQDISQSTRVLQYDQRVRDSLLHLIEAFKQGGKRLIVNTQPLQSRADDIATCGKHCTARILFKSIVDPAEYFNFLTLDPITKSRSVTKDEIVSLMFL